MALDSLQPSVLQCRLPTLELLLTFQRCAELFGIHLPQRTGAQADRIGVHCRGGAQQFWQGQQLPHAGGCLEGAWQKRCEPRGRLLQQRLRLIDLLSPMQGGVGLCQDRTQSALAATLESLQGLLDGQVLWFLHCCLIQFEMQTPLLQCGVLVNESAGMGGIGAPDRFPALTQHPLR